MRLLILLVLFFAPSALASEFRVEAAFTPPPQVGEATTLRFSIFRGTKLVTGNDLDLTHTRLIHLFMLDAGFLNYLHEHPSEAKPGVWELPVIVQKAGRYRLWLQFQPHGTEDGELLTFDEIVQSRQSDPLPSTPVDTKIRRQVTVGDYQVSLSYPRGEPRQHGMTTMRLIVKKDGKEIPPSQLDDFLGAKYHICAVDSKRLDFAHVHPGGDHGGGHNHGDADPRDAMIHFMRSGFYGVFVQFSHQGQVYTAQFGDVIKGH